MKFLEQQSITKFSSLLIAMISFIIAVILPLGYFIIAYQQTKGVAGAEIEFRARAIERIVANNPESWQFEEIRLQEIMEDRLKHQTRDRRIIRDLQGNVIAETKESLTRPVITFSGPIYDSGKEVARMEIECSINPIVINTFLFGALSAGIAIIIFLLFYFVPLRTVREAYERVQKSEEMYSMLVDTIPDAVIQSDINGNITFVNNHTLRISGYNREEMEGHSIFNFISPEEHEKAMRNISLMIEGKLGSLDPLVEYQLIMKNGTKVPFEVNGEILRDRDGTTCGMVSLCHNLTERKRAEEKIQENEEKYRMIAEKMTDIVWISDIDLRTIYNTPSVRTVLGFSQEEFSSKTLEEQVTPDSLAIAMETLARELAIEKQGDGDPNRTINLIMEFYHKDGSTRWLEMIITGIRDDQGVLTGLHGVSRDITERKRAEESIKESEEKYRLIAEKMTDIAWMTDMNFRVLYVSPSIQKVLGFTQEERMQQTIYQQFTPESISYGFEVLARELAIEEQGNGDANRTETLVVEHYHKDGSTRWMEIIIGGLRDAQGVLIGLHGVSRDITERKRAEESIKESEEKYRMIAEKITDVVWIADKDFYTQYITPSVQKVLGFSLEDLPRKLEEQVTPDSLAIAMETMARELVIEKQGLGDPNRVVNIVMEYYHKDGSTRWLEALITGIRNEQGVLTGLHGVSRDITKRKQAEEALKAANKQLQDIIEFLPDAAVIADKENKIIAWNRAMEEMTGISKTQVLGHHYRQTTIPLYGEERLFLMDLVAKDDEELKTKYSNVRRIGNIVHAEAFTPALYNNKGAYVSAVAGPLRDVDGNIIGKIELMRDVTIRRQAEEKLRKSEELFTKVVNTIPDLIIHTDLDGKILFVNDHALQVSGYTWEEIEGQNMLTFISPDDRDKAIENMPHMMENRLGPKEYHLLMKDGRKVPFEVNGDVLRNQDGIPVGLVNVCRDISERKRSEKILREQDERLRGIIQNLPGIVYQFYATEKGEYGVTYASEPLNKFAELFSNVDMTNLPAVFLGFVSRIPEEDRDKFFESIKTKVEKKMPWNYEGRLILPSGEMIWFDAMSIPKYYENQLVYDGLVLDITERKMAEEALTAANKQLQDIIEFLPDATMIVDKDNKLIAWNRAMEEMTGVPEAAIIGQDHHQASIPFYGEVRPFLMDLVGLNDQELEDKYFNVKRVGSAVHAEVFTPALYNNRGAYVLAVASPLLDTDGNIVGLIESIRDITERKQAELQRESALESLQKSEEKYRTIIENIEDGYAEMDLKGNFLFVNDALCKIDGYPENELMKLNYRDIMDEENAKKVYAAYHKVFITGESEKNIEYEISTKSGVKKYLETSIKPIKGADGRVVAFRSIVRDRTERILAEEKFYTVFMTSPDLIGITRLKDGLITDVNKGFEHISGWKMEEAIGTKSTEPPLNFWVVAADRELMVTELKAGRDVTHREIKFRRKDGSIGIGNYSARTMNVDGEESLIFIMRDITEQNRMEKELVETHKVRVMNQIASGVAHEVRNPLHAIQAISEAMAIEVDEKSDYKEYLIHIKAQVTRLSHLMNDLLDLGKPIPSSQLSQASLKEIVATSLKYWREAHPHLSQKIKVVKNFQRDKIVLVDTNKIQQVIINLMDNAVKHSPQDGEILLEYDKVSGNCVVVRIVDKGTGIKVQDLPKVFEPFFTSSKGGTGLGLSLCKHIIESHGGTIEIVNNKNAPGCTAKFTLPVYNIKEHK